MAGGKARAVRALSLWQPHGSLLVTGAKPFETRGRLTKVRGEILLHASARCIFDEMTFWLSKPNYRAGLAPLVGQPAKGHQGFWFGHLEPKDLADNPLISVV
jgi:hypothetical protein